MEQMSKKRIVGLCIAIAALISILLVTLVVNVQSCNEKRNAYVTPLLRITDQATNVSYDISGHETTHISYDGLEHSFTFVVLREDTKKPMGRQRGKLDKIVKYPGKYEFHVDSYYKQYHNITYWTLIIDELEETENQEKL